MATFEVCGDDGAILFLSCSVPDVEFSRLVFKVYVFDFKVDGGHLCFFFCEEITFGEPPEECSFANIAISYNDDLVSLLIFVVRQISFFNHYNHYNKSNQLFIQNTLHNIHLHHPSSFSAQSTVLLINLKILLEGVKYNNIASYTVSKNVISTQSTSSIK